MRVITDGTEIPAQDWLVCRDLVDERLCTGRRCLRDTFGDQRVKQYLYFNRAAHTVAGGPFFVLLSRDLVEHGCHVTRHKCPFEQRGEGVSSSVAKYEKSLSC